MDEGRFLTIHVNSKIWEAIGKIRSAQAGIYSHLMDEGYREKSNRLSSIIEELTEMVE